MKNVTYSCTNESVKVTYDTGNFGSVHKFVGTDAEWKDLQRKHGLIELSYEVME